jgi:hypothetical protein
MYVYVPQAVCAIIGYLGPGESTQLSMTHARALVGSVQVS